MLHLKKKLSLFFLLLLSFNLHANTFEKLTSFQADFSQTITNPSGTKAYYKGLISIQEPNQIKWQYLDPFEKYVYIKKNTVTIIEPELEQVIITKLDKEINIINLLKNAIKKSTNTYISNYNNVKYTLLLNDNKLKEISYIDEIENNVLISFQNIQQNQKIDTKNFKFHIPLEYDIIKK